MNKNNNGQSKERLYKFVKDIVDQAIKQHDKRNKNVFARVATVTAYNSTTKIVTVYFAGDDPSNTTTFKNKSNETLSNGNEVYVFCIGSLMNAYVAVKK